MKDKYEKSILTITLFSKEDVISTSDRNNTYLEENALDQSADAAREAPTR